MTIQWNKVLHLNCKAMNLFISPCRIQSLNRIARVCHESSDLSELSKNLARVQMYIRVTIMGVVIMCSIINTQWHTRASFH